MAERDLSALDDDQKRLRGLHDLDHRPSAVEDLGIDPRHAQLCRINRLAAHVTIWLGAAPPFTPHRHQGPVKSLFTGFARRLNSRTGRAAAAETLRSRR